MKRLLILILMTGLIFIFFGCSNDSSVSRQINITWESDGSIQPENKYYSNTPTPLMATGVKIKAELLEDGKEVEDAKFKFAEEKGSPKFNITEKRNKSFTARFEEHGEGTLKAREVNTDTIKDIKYKVFKAIQIGDTGEHYKGFDYGYDFDAKEYTDKENGDLYFDNELELYSRYKWTMVDAPDNDSLQAMDDLDVSELTYDNEPGLMYANGEEDFIFSDKFFILKLDDSTFVKLYIIGFLDKSSFTVVYDKIEI